MSLFDANWVIWAILDLLQVGNLKYSKYNDSRTGSFGKVNLRATKKYYQTEEGAAEYQAMKQKLEFEVLLMSYVMIQDDERLSLEEINLFRDHVYPFNGTLTRKDFNGLRKLLKQHSSSTDIIKFVQMNHIDASIIEQGFGLLRILNQVTGRYGGVIESLERQFQHHIEYFM